MVDGDDGDDKFIELQPISGDWRPKTKDRGLCGERKGYSPESSFL